ncbi:MAG: ROK family protein, partial [Nanoarchaeota archaeon]
FDVVGEYGKVDAICVSTAGFLRDGKIVNSLNNDLDGVRLLSVLKKKFKTRVFVENDASCAALAELHYGAGKGKKNFVLLTLGSGIGGGVIVDGRLLRGRGGAAEVGSMHVDGEKYIWEELASGHASVRIAREIGLKGINSLELEKRANKGDKKAKKVYDIVGKNIGMGISNLAYIFDPELIIVGGGFSRVKYIYPSMHATFNKLYKLNPKPKIVKARFGDDAGLVGASLLVKEKR